MATNFKVLIPAKQAENAQTTQYTATNVTAIIDKFTVTNTTGTAATFAANLVTSGDTAADDNLLIDDQKVSILPGETYPCPELVGHVLGAGDFISTLAGTASALTIRCSGREISN